MKYWLVKSEPDAWSWRDHVKAGVAEWDGVRNHQANNNMKLMKEGDKAFFYHSVSEKQIVGVLEVVSRLQIPPKHLQNTSGNTYRGMCFWAVSFLAPYTSKNMYRLR